MGVEKNIEKSIVQYLALNGCKVTKVHSGSLIVSGRGRGGVRKDYKVTLAEEGTTDIVACIKGRYVGIEVKKDEEEVEAWERYPLGKRGYKLKPDKRIEAQKRERDRISQSQGIHIITASLEGLIKDLESIGLGF